MGKIITIFLLMMSVPVMAGGDQGHIQQQEAAGKWVNDSWKDAVQTKMRTNLDKEQQVRCDKKLKYYTAKFNKKPNSEYYKSKLEKWTKRCGGTVAKPVK